MNDDGLICKKVVTPLADKVRACVRACVSECAQVLRGSLRRGADVVVVPVARRGRPRFLRGRCAR